MKCQTCKTESEGASGLSLGKIQLAFAEKYPKGGHTHLLVQLLGLEKVLGRGNEPKYTLTNMVS